jgi:hypothetical protein
MSAKAFAKYPGLYGTLEQYLLSGTKMTPSGKRSVFFFENQLTRFQIEGKVGPGNDQLQPAFFSLPFYRHPGKIAPD